MKDLLEYKNSKYGNIGLEPINVLSRMSPINGLLQRADDKIARLKNRKEELPSKNDLCDLIGYCVLLLSALDIKKEDFEKQKD
jgi:hypothetical protein